MNAPLSFRNRTLCSRKPSSRGRRARQNPPDDGLSRSLRGSRDDGRKASRPSGPDRGALPGPKAPRSRSVGTAPAFADEGPHQRRAIEVDAGMVQTVPSSVSVVDFDSTRRVEEASGWTPQLDEFRKRRGLCGLRSASVTAIGPRAGRSAPRADASLSMKVFVHSSDTLSLGT
jgi:hypothetical protein